MNSPVSPPRRPSASWVLGRSERWHDPEFLAEIDRQEKLAALGELHGLGASLASGGLFAPILLLRAVRGLWRLHAHLQGRRDGG